MITTTAIVALIMAFVAPDWPAVGALVVAGALGVALVLL